MHVSTGAMCVMMINALYPRFKLLQRERHDVKNVRIYGIHRIEKRKRTSGTYFYKNALRSQITPKQGEVR